MVNGSVDFKWLIIKGFGKETAVNPSFKAIVNGSVFCNVFIISLLCGWLPLTLWRDIVRIAPRY